jgi:hypothetical protein
MSITGPGSEHRLSQARIRRILVGIDFSDAANAALASAVAVARRVSAHLSIVHVVADPCDERWAKESTSTLEISLIAWPSKPRADCARSRSGSSGTLSRERS